MTRAVLVLLALAALLTAAVSPALAHAIKVFATVDGTTIAGTVYIPGGGKVNGAEVTAAALDGAALGSATTDAEGAFAIEAARRVDHLLEVVTGDGHRATFRIDAAQLPPSLPGPGPAETAAPPAPAPAPAVSHEALEAAVARAVASQVTPLREQIAAYEDRLRLHDILGGIGWMVGVAGLGFFLLARKERRRGG